MGKSNSIYAIMLLLLLSSCDKIKYKPVDFDADQTTLSPLAKEALESKFAKYRAKLEDKCKEKALKSAIKHVDSLIIQELKFQHVEDASFPSRPTRPRLPEGII